MVSTCSVLREDQSQSHGQEGKQNRNGKRGGKVPPKNMFYDLGKAQFGLEWEVVVVLLIEVIRRFKGFHGWNRGHIVPLSLRL